MLKHWNSPLSSLLRRCSLGSSRNLSSRPKSVCAGKCMTDFFCIISVSGTTVPLIGTLHVRNVTLLCWLIHSLPLAIPISLVLVNSRSSDGERLELANSFKDHEKEFCAVKMVRPSAGTTCTRNEKFAGDWESKGNRVSQQRDFGNREGDVA